MIGWLSANRPDDLQRLLPDGRFHYDGASARLWLEILEDWNRAAQQPAGARRVLPLNGAAIMIRRLILAGISGSMLLAACAPDRAETNKETVRRMIAAIDARELDALDDLVAANVRRHSAATPGTVVESLEQFKAFLREDQAAVPDSKQEIELILAEDDWVAVYAHYRGTQRGQFGPFPPTDRRFALPFIAVLRLDAGKVAEMWVEWDNLHALSQLGHFPPPIDCPGGQVR